MAGEADRWLSTQEGVLEDLEKAVNETRDIRRPDQAKKLEWQGIGMLLLLHTNLTSVHAHTYGMLW
jgi:hypothetical protein